MSNGENTRVWEAVSRPPVTALKKISGGRLTGKSDINPQWRYKVMTEQFGPCGVGWKYTIDRLWTEPGVDGVVFAFAQVSVYTLVPDIAAHPSHSDYWSAPIPGVGGHKLIEAEKSGLYNNDEAFKMCVTDALGVALKMLGVAADIYLGTFDGSKYLTPPDEEVRQDAARQEQVRKDAEKTGMAILKVAAEQGHKDLELSWKSISKVMREACTPHWGDLKKRALEVDEQKKGVAHAAEATD